MQILVLDGSSNRLQVGLVASGEIVRQRCAAIERGQAEAIAGLIASVLEGQVPLDAIAATTGPGNFTGLRAVLSVAEGLALALGVPVIGVSVPDALRASCDPVAGEVVWIVQAARTGLMALDVGDGPMLRPDGDWPTTSTSVVLVGSRAADLFPSLVERGVSARLGQARHPDIVAIADIAARQVAGQLPRQATTPLYLDAAVTTRGAAPRPPPSIACP